MENSRSGNSPTRFPPLIITPPELTQTRSGTSIDSGSDHGKLRSRVDSALDKLKKDKTRSSTDGEEPRRGSPDSGRRLSKLIPSRSRSKAKKRLSWSHGAPSNGDGDGEGRLGDSSPRPTRPKSMLVDRSLSQEELDSPRDASGGSRSSLLTEDSDMDTSPARAPPLVSHPSHENYLTLSSPLISTQTIATPEVAPDPIQPTTVNPLDRRDTIRSSSPASSPTRLATHADKLRGVFAPGANASKQGSVSDTDPVKSDSSGFLGLIAGGKKNSRKDTKATSRPTTPSNTSQSRDIIIPGTLLTDSPTTVITPPTPTDSQSKSSPIPLFAELKAPAATHNTSTSGSSLIESVFSGGSIAHRRSKSVSSNPSKLSNSILRPLTPAIEEIKTPGGTLTSPTSSTGFFSSFVSATQNAVTSLTTFSSQPSTHQRSKSALPVLDSDLGDAPESEDNNEEEAVVEPAAELPKREPAVATLGSGDLSLTLLGIPESGDDPSLLNSKPDLSDDYQRSRSMTQSSAATQGTTQTQSTVQTLTDDNAYLHLPPLSASAEQLNLDKPYSAPGRISPTRSQSIPAAVLSPPHDHTPPRSFKEESELGSGTRRTGSVRSKISGQKKRSRGMSRDSGGTIATAIAGYHSAAAATVMSNPISPNRRPTGYAVASSKRNKDFHALFRSVPEDDYLIEDYSAALQRDILLHGRMYVSERHICFSSNILGWVTSLVISFDEVVAMEKKMTAVIFPNAIVIQTLHARNTFASFISRDSTYDLLIGIWKIGHPNLKASLNGHTLDDSGHVDKSAVARYAESDGGSEDDSEFSDEDGEFDDDDGSEAENEGSIAGSEVVEPVKPTPVKTMVNGTAPKGTEAQTAPSAPSPASDFPGPSSHAVTECSDQDSHYDKPLVDTTIPAPLGQVYSMMFGPTSGVVMRKFLVDDQKYSDVQMEDDKKGMGEENKSFSYSYIKPLTAPIGPKQTKCVINQTLDAFDLTKAVSVTCSTQTPDVPSGNVFVTKTKYCLMWGPNNSTRFIMNYTVEWSGKSWFKGPIEKGALDGQTLYGKDIVAFFKSAVATKLPSKGTTGSKSKGKRSKRGRSASTKSTPSQEKGFKNAKDMAQSGKNGAFGQLQGLLEPIGSIFGPMISTSGILTVLLVVMTALWFRQPSQSSGRYASILPGSLEKMVAYEELWRQEESELWNWMEERLDMDSLSNLGAATGKIHYLVPRHASDLTDQMTARQVDEAIRVTEARLAAFKLSMERQKRKQAASPLAS